jgi:prepilin-type N-terminal cleavage/methylation domain-containing protein
MLKNSRVKIRQQAINANRGFTLIEVLLASIILFLFLTLAAQAFSQSAVASRKAERAVKLAGLVPLLLENIRTEIDQAKQLGEQTANGSLLGVNYQWQATLLSRAKPAFSFDQGGAAIDGQERYNLWQVELSISLVSNDAEKNYQRTWQYTEVTWHK